MSDEPKVAETVTPVQAPVETVEELKERLEQTKKAQAGSDRQYQETAKRAAILEAELETLKKEKMSEKEKNEYEAIRMMDEAKKLKQEAADATLRLLKTQKMAIKNLPLELLDRIHGTNELEIDADIDTLNKYIENIVAERINKKFIDTKKPQAGSEPDKKNVFDGKNVREIEKMIKDGLH